MYIHIEIFTNGQSSFFFVSFFSLLFLKKAAMVCVPSTPCRSPTNVAGLSRMTITVLASSSAMGQVVKQLNGDLFIYYTYIFNNVLFFCFAFARKGSIRKIRTAIVACVEHATTAFALGFLSFSCSNKKCYRGRRSIHFPMYI